MTAPTMEPQDATLPESLENPPDAGRLIYGLRDTGYSFNTAAADIIDNSIAAEATEIHVRIQLMEDGRKFVLFGDDGQGMSPEELFAAMRYGADERKSLASLGKFGLGLKTASSSVCLRFTVISRRDKSAALTKLAWDLDHVRVTDKWEMIREPVTDDEEDMFSELCGDHGTLVIWSKCDRLLSKEYSDPGGAKEQAAIKRLSKSLSDHISLIYYRFLIQDDERERNVSIFVNDENVGGWNPFLISKSEQMIPLARQQLPIELVDGSTENANIRAWILPHRKDLNAEEEAEAKISNRGQGFYIHREGRVIQQGGWLGVFGTLEPHSSLLRVEFDFDHKLDDAFKVDVKKSRISFDPGLEAGLKRILNPIHREAKARYRRTSQAENAENGVDHSSANKSIEKNPSVRKPTVVDVDPVTGEPTISNNQGARIRLKAPVENRVSAESVYVEAVDDIRTGGLWEPALRSNTDSGHTTGVRLNKHHDFYQKVYQRAASDGHMVEGIDLLLWALSAAEQNHTNPELEPVFEDLREEVSANLRKLLRDVDLPAEDELAPMSEGQDV